MFRTTSVRYALSEQPQEELYELFNEHLRRLERLSTTETSLVLAHLSQAIFHLLALAGIAPQVQVCCVTQHSLEPDFTNPDWRVGFSLDAGGTVSLEDNELGVQKSYPPITTKKVIRTTESGNDQFDIHPTPPPKLSTKLDAFELTLLQNLGETELPQLNTVLPDQPGDQISQTADTVWAKVERVLRDYAQYHFGKSIRSAALVDALSIPDL